MIHADIRSLVFTPRSGVKSTKGLPELFQDIFNTLKILHFGFMTIGEHGMGELTVRRISD
jgi:hypothetical protein